MDPTIIMFCWYIMGSVCFAVGSAVGIANHLGVL